MLFVKAKSYKTVLEQYPGAAILVKVEGGYTVFMTVTAYDVWKNQK
jgi:hypothetical protein